MYTRNKNNALKRRYRIFVRAQKAQETLNTDDQVLGLLQYAGNIGLATSSVTIDDVGESHMEENKHFLCSTDGDDGSIDFNDAVISGTAEDIIIIEMEDNERLYSILVTDEDSNTVTLSVIGDYVLMVYRDSKWQILCSYFAPDDGFVSHTNEEMSSTYREIGMCEATPTIVGSEAETIDGNYEKEITISENLEMNVSLINVTKDNYDYLRYLTGYLLGKMDFAFCDIDRISDTILLKDVVIKALPEITGNNVNKVQIVASKEQSNLDDSLIFYEEA